MKIDVINSKGEQTGRSIELPKAVFGQEPNEHAVYLAVKQYLAHQRQGTHKTKERGEIKGSTRKLHRQKGTGGSRKGSIKNPLFRGGGRVFGPRPRNYVVRLNKKVKQLAKVSALSSKAGEGAIVVMEDYSIETPKTKEFNALLGNLNLQDQKALFVTAEMERGLVLSSRNIKKSSVEQASNLNVFQILNAGTLVFSESAIAMMGESIA